MTKEKWVNIVVEEMDKMAERVSPLDDGPENWLVCKAALYDMITAIDNVTEVYNKESN